MSKSLCDKTIQVLAGYLAKACRSENYCNYIILLKGNLPPLPHISGFIFINWNLQVHDEGICMHKYSCITTDEDGRETNMEDGNIQLTAY